MSKTKANKPFTAKRGEKALREKSFADREYDDNLAIHTKIDDLVNHVYQDGYEQGKKESLLLRDPAKKALAKSYDPKELLTTDELAQILKESRIATLEEVLKIWDEVMHSPKFPEQSTYDLLRKKVEQQLKEARK